MVVTEFRDVFGRFSKAEELLLFWRPLVGLHQCTALLLLFRTDFTWNNNCKELCTEDILLVMVTSRRLPQRLCLCHYTDTVS